MDTTYDNKLSGALFKNDKGDNPKRPDYTGNYTHSDGVEFKVSAWIKEGKNGTKFMSFKMQEKETKPEPNKPTQSAHTPKQEYHATVTDDDLPF
jgi:hypothetical protein